MQTDSFFTTQGAVMAKYSSCYADIKRIEKAMKKLSSLPTEIIINKLERKDYQNIIELHALQCLLEEERLKDWPFDRLRLLFWKTKSDEVKFALLISMKRFDEQIVLPTYNLAMHLGKEFAAIIENCKLWWAFKNAGH